MEKNKVLVIDDDKNIGLILKDYFEFEGFEVIVAYDGESGLRMVEEANPDIIILDIMLPKLNGWEICQKLRPQNSTPIIMLSAKNKDVDRITGLELGADDYVNKPFNTKELVARVKAVLRRVKESSTSKELKFKKFLINKVYRRVEVNGEKVDLTPKEFDLLWTLASSSKRVFKREDLLNNVWGYDYYGDTRTVDTHIKSIRSKLSKGVDDYIKTVWGVGYKFEAKENKK
ncbi:response regulator transcription factor [Halonatronum saccharophilum]|uniref:response regulator transcription factor n=1 Tax=Halonatronum saccharophilum TaxID=150060 RepID=UPI0004878C6A|nr:response regulator transcription factor [Halonatronum saccharophilum]